MHCYYYARNNIQLTAEHHPRKHTARNRHDKQHLQEPEAVTSKQLFVP
jgi:hypothetical protein